MARGFDLATLAYLYDRGGLVPFTGSGMSIGECHDWDGFVGQLTRNAGVAATRGKKGDPIRQAAGALELLRREGLDIGDAVRKSVYIKIGRKPSHNRALAQLHWPLICTTNYDDVYLKEAFRSRKALPTVRGRSESHCRRVLQHMSLPAGEVVWALQGFLVPRTKATIPCVGDDAVALQKELVVGPVEYRQAAHLSPHFRRCFSELFRSRSLLFLGAGLSEPYILNLFDEIIALAGPPSRPHFALVQDGSLDVDLMRDHYHIICNTYPKGAHDRVSESIESLASLVLAQRARPRGWSYRVNTPAMVTAEHSESNFEVVRAPLPLPKHVGKDEVIAISCGRDRGDGHRGKPMPGRLIKNRVPRRRWADPRWLNDWTVTWNKDASVCGIVARHLHKGNDSSSRDARSPDAVRLAFKEFLRETSSRGVTRVHVQLLSAGQGRAFRPWISLVQMARAYGQWVKERPRSAKLPSVVVYVVTPDVVALLNAGQLHLAEHLQDALIRINVEIIDGLGMAQTHQEFVDAKDRLGDLTVFSKGPPVPRVHAVPSPHAQSGPKPLDKWMRKTELRDFGLVSGSTLVVDYSKRQP